MRTLLFKVTSLNCSVDNGRNISNIALKAKFNVLFIYSWKNKRQYYIEKEVKNNNKTQIKDVK